MSDLWQRHFNQGELFHAQSEPTILGWSLVEESIGADLLHTRVLGLLNGGNELAVYGSIVDPPEHQAALGGFASNLVGEPYSIHPWFGIAEIGSGKNKNKILATISQTSGSTVYPVAELMERLSGSGVPELPGSGGHIMMVAGDGGTSNAVAYRIEGDETKAKYSTENTENVLP